MRDNGWEFLCHSETAMLSGNGMIGIRDGPVFLGVLWSQRRPREGHRTMRDTKLDKLGVDWWLGTFAGFCRSFQPHTSAGWQLLHQSHVADGFFRATLLDRQGLLLAVV